jgi:uncharacterized protein (DUF1800 family)
MNQSLRALNRFGLGARIDEARTISDPRGWLRSQLDGGPPRIPAATVASPDAIGDALRALRAPTPDPEMRQTARRRVQEIAAAESQTAFSFRVTSERPFVERLVAFWSNHLCVSAAAKIIVAPLAGLYEREVIRAHVLGRFEDMVLASAQHPAMLVYLDNYQSIGPGSRGAQGNARRGLNENYARELLELHTLGVDGGYTQQDVQELARLLTGWTVAGLGGGGARQSMPMAPARARRLSRAGAVRATDGAVTFAFQENLHEPGPKTVLGVRYGAGLAQGERAIRALCQHPSTARFVATKLVTHFVADTPPASAVERIADVFRESRGDLRAVASALIDLPDAWNEEHRKFRTPQDWLTSVFRTVRGTDINDRAVPFLRQLRHPFWSPQAPKGFGDTTQEWADPDSLLNRAELSRTLARRFASQRIDPRLLLDAVDVAPEDPVTKLVSDASIGRDERIALALASPAFQWR